MDWVLTFGINYTGYLLGALVVVYAFRRGNPLLLGVGTATWALLLLFAAALGWFSYTEELISREGHETIPLWLESSNKIAENIQSEVWQVWLAMKLFVHLREPGSPESK